MSNYERFLQDYVLAVLKGRSGAGYVVNKSVIDAAHEAWILIQAQIDSHRSTQSSARR